MPNNIIVPKGKILAQALPNNKEGTYTIQCPINLLDESKWLIADKVGERVYNPRSITGTSYTKGWYEVQDIADHTLDPDPEPDYEWVKVVEGGSGIGQYPTLEDAPTPTSEDVGKVIYKAKDEPEKRKITPVTKGYVGVTTVSGEKTFVTTSVDDSSLLTSLRALDSTYTCEEAWSVKVGFDTLFLVKDSSDFVSKQTAYVAEMQSAHPTYFVDAGGTHKNFRYIILALNPIQMPMWGGSSANVVGFWECVYSTQYGWQCIDKSPISFPSTCTQFHNMLYNGGYFKEMDGVDIDSVGSKHFFLGYDSNYVEQPLETYPGLFKANSSNSWELANNVTTTVNISNNVDKKIRFGIDTYGRYGYIEDGADSVIPFSTPCLWYETYMFYPYRVTNGWCYYLFYIRMSDGSIKVSSNDVGDGSGGEIHGDLSTAFVYWNDNTTHGKTFKLQVRAEDTIYVEITRYRNSGQDLQEAGYPQVVEYNLLSGQVTHEWFKDSSETKDGWIIPIPHTPTDLTSGLYQEAFTVRIRRVKD